MSIKYMGSLLLLTWPILSFSELPQKSARLENYSVQNGFNRTLPLTTAAYKSTIKTPAIKAKSNTTTAKVKTVKMNKPSAVKLPQKSARVENYSVDSGFNRSVTSTPDTQTIPFDSLTATIKEKPNNSVRKSFRSSGNVKPNKLKSASVPKVPPKVEGLENYSAQMGFNRSLPKMATIHQPKIKTHASIEESTITKKSKSSASKMKRSYVLITKRQPHKKGTNHKEQMTIVKQEKNQQITKAVKQKSIYRKNAPVKKNANPPSQQLQTVNKKQNPKQYSKQCAQLYKYNDFSHAIAMCEKAAEHNDSQAALYLAKIYSIGTASISPDHVKAHFYATMAANQNNAEAQFFLALAYENGIGVKQNKKSASHWYQQAAQNGLSGAKTIDGGTELINKTATHVTWPGTAEYKQALLELKKPNTHESGFEMLSQAAQMGHPIAKFQLAMKYLQGDNIPQDDAKALDLLTQSADKGYTPAQTYLAWMNILGLGITPNTEQAVQYYLEAKHVVSLDENDATVQAKLAALTANPDSIRIQPLSKTQKLAELQRGIDLMEMSTDGSAEGLAIISNAAQDNSIEAQLYLAQLYQQGDKVSKDDESAAKWYQRAANSGNSDAQYALGWLHFYGQGVPKNTQQALACFMKASLLGNERAKQATSFVQAQLAKETVNQAATENALRPTIASKVKEKVTDNVNGIFKAMGFNGFSKKS